MATFPVKWYASEMQGAPNLGDTSAGALTALLKAVLVTGFGTLTLNSLVWDAAENAAKATISGGHAYLKDSVIEVTGASPAAYNGEHRVKKVSTTEVWFELDGGNPGASASGTLTMKVAPLGWTLTHESADGMVAIYRPTDVSASGNVSLRIDNTAFSGWTGTSSAYLAKAQLVEDVVGIDTYTLIYDHRWPATKRYSDGRWDLIGDSQLLFFLPAYAAHNYQALLMFGYINSVRPGDRYHALLATYCVQSANDTARRWDASTSSPSYAYVYNNLLSFDESSHRVIARAYHQLYGTTVWWLKGVFPRFGTGLTVPNGPDNGFYLCTDPIMVLETNNHLRGHLPGVVVPYANLAAWGRKNFKDMPALPGKIVRFVQATYNENSFNYAPTLIGFDLTGPWR
ncbi:MULTISPECIES: hypothetical protein [Aeromonas]|uniref:Uncharacterized protein n=2 Tax=Aeromonas caviae TaxID=648 RepID=A0AA43ALE5_AERCA|nr:MULTISPECIES: hypothetical protein [Aeromonas]MBP4059424.1 hypothetical protein [Aeromonas sp. Prich7-2]MCW4617969.1 hypothetical protein [Aeromonas hydrophila]MDH0309554.1 hypothetical protein [Aeromonas caviae]MDH0319883.1 hypothetical protein [Aeromonas caviae]MDH0360375.1 hypothetical protein [Aeromonas caviae]